jgi:hypothetical protein
MKRLSLLGGSLVVCLAASGCLSSSNEGPSLPDAGHANDAGTDGSVTIDAGSPPGSDASQPDTSAEDAATNPCAAATTGPTLHGGSVNTETFTAAASPHILQYDTTVYGTLTIEPCAEVLIGPQHVVTISATGRVVAEGTATSPIHIGASDTTKPFANIRTTGGGTLRLAYTTIDGGGDRLNTLASYAGTIDLQGKDNAKPTQEIISVDHLTLKGSLSNGIVLRDGAGFAADSTSLTISGAAEYPVNIWARASGTLPSGKYTGNAYDEILLPALGLNESIQEDTTLHDRGVPYHVGYDSSSGDLRVSAGNTGLATLTIEAGVVLRFKKGAILEIEHFSGTNPATGALIAIGTAEKPIVFTSAEAAPAAGDWLGIDFGEIPNPNGRIDFARVEYAGGKSTSGSDACIGATNTNNDAAIRIFGPPASQFITNTIILESAAHGIDRGYRSDTKIDFLPTNTFTNVALCKQSYPKDANGGCPTTIPCP